MQERSPTAIVFPKSTHHDPFPAHRLPALLEPHVRLAKVNTEDEQQLAARFNIRSIPTLALFVNGREVARQAGAFRSAQDIAGWVRARCER